MTGHTFFEGAYGIEPVTRLIPSVNSLFGASATVPGGQWRFAGALGAARRVEEVLCSLAGMFSLTRRVG
jgi:hypothetical protein